MTLTLIIALILLLLFFSLLLLLLLLPYVLEDPHTSHGITRYYEQAHYSVENIMYVLFLDLRRSYYTLSHGHGNHWESSCTSLSSSSTPSPPIHKTQNMLVINVLIRFFLQIVNTHFSNQQNRFKQQLRIVRNKYPCFTMYSSFLWICLSKRIPSQ